MKNALLSFLIYLLLGNQAFAALAIDGSGTGTGTPNATATITTTSINDVVIATLTNNTSFTCSGVSGGGLTWTQRGPTLVYNASTTRVYEFYAIASSPLTAQVITAACSGTSTTRLNVVGISGANIGSPFDGNASFPAQAGFTDATQNIAVTISTNNANTLLLGNVFASSTGIGRPSGFTQILATGASQDLSKSVVSSIQSGVTETWSWTGATTSRALIVDAIQQASSGVVSNGLLMDSAF